MEELTQTILELPPTGLIPVVLLVLALLVREPLRNGPLGGVLKFFDHEGFYADL